MLTKEFISEKYCVVDGKQIIRDVSAALCRDRFVVVLSDGLYRGMLFVFDALNHEDSAAEEYAKSDLKCFDDEDFAESLNDLIDTGAPAAPVFSSATGAFLGVFSLFHLFSSMRKAQLGMAHVVVNNTLGPLDLEDAKNDFYCDVSRSMRDPLQRISSLSNMLKHTESESNRLLLCYSIDAAVDQINKTFEILMKDTDARLRSCHAPTAAV